MEVVIVLLIIFSTAILAEWMIDLLTIRKGK